MKNSPFIEILEFTLYLLRDIIDEKLIKNFYVDAVEGEHEKSIMHNFPSIT